MGHVNRGRGWGVEREGLEREGGGGGEMTQVQTFVEVWINRASLLH